MNLGLKNKYRSTASLFLNLTLFALPALVQAAPMSIDSITFSDGTNSADKATTLL